MNPPSLLKKTLVAVLVFLLAKAVLGLLPTI